MRHRLKTDALEPWQHHSWIFVTDPDFRPRAQRVLDLYARTFEGTALATSTSSARTRRPPARPLAPGQARAMRVNQTYRRGGALAYSPPTTSTRRRGVRPRCEETTGIVPFVARVTQVMSQEPYASAKGLFWIVDIGSSHRGKKATDRLTTAFPNAVMVNTPVRASWLNQVEIYFSVVQRKVVQPNDFIDLSQMRGPALGLREPLQRHGTAVPLEVHHLRAGRSTGQPRPAHHRSPRRILRRPGSMIHPRRTSSADHLERARRTGLRVDEGEMDAAVQGSWLEGHWAWPPSAGHIIRWYPSASAFSSSMRRQPRRVAISLRCAGRWSR